MSKLYVISVVAIKGGEISHFALFDEFDNEDAAKACGYKTGSQLYPNAT